MLTERSYSQWFVSALIVLTPILMTIAIIPLGFGFSLTDYVPLSSDEKFYWHQIWTYQQVGFDGGYYSRDERPPQAQFSRFYTKGPVFPMLYGTMARLTGWQTYTAIFYNIGIMTLALFIFVVVVPLTKRQGLLLLIFWVTFWPTWLYTHKIMQEALLDAVAIITAVLFYRVLTQRDALSSRAKWSFAVFIFLTSLIRGGTWVIFFAPLLLIGARDKRLFPLFLEGLKSLILAGVAFWFFGLFLSPASNFASDLPTSRAGLRRTATIIRDNLMLFNIGHPLWIVLRYQTLIGGLTALGGLIIALWRNRRDAIQQWFVGRDQLFWERVFHAINLLGIIAANIILYDVLDWRDYRVIRPHMLVSALLLIAFQRYRWVILLIMSNLLFLLPFDGNFPTAWRELNEGNYTTLRQPLIADDVSQLLVYDASAPSGWCNTLLVIPTDLIFELDVRTIPAGIGLSLTNQNFDSITLPPKSQYLLLDDDMYDKMKDELRLEHLLKMPTGALYKNLDADCDP